MPILSYQLSKRRWLVLGMPSLFYLLYPREASCLAVSWHMGMSTWQRPPGNGQWGTEALRPTILEELNPTNSPVRNLGSRLSLVEAPAIHSATPLWDIWVRRTKRCCTQIPDLTKLKWCSFKQLSFRGISYAVTDTWYEDVHYQRCCKGGGSAGPVPRSHWRGLWKHSSSTAMH